MAFLVTSCKKDHGDDCESLPDGPLTGYQYSESYPYYQFPDINPANNNEIVYYKKSSSQPYNAIYAYNITTQQIIFLAEDALFNKPIWKKII
ncbi:MAG: hypothetical protein M0D57_10485 [Sphingobacteriales bacterium JAD_PAG50586_3]|nr:MAG: hypothetical protein M0D57_10485 [Sphingobacteriales bacterium JAD_PAG50586_3]